MNAHVASLMEMGREALETAQHNLKGGYFRGAINRAYYTVFYAARAALFLADETPKTHNGVIRRFQARFIQPGQLDRSLGEIIGRAFQLRHDADYDDGALITREDAVALIADASTFLRTIERFLADEPPLAS